MRLAGVVLAGGQAVVALGVAWLLQERSTPDAALACAAAAGQGLAAVGVLRASPRWLRAGAWVSLAAFTLLYARLGLLVVGIYQVFGPEPGGQALDVLGAALLAVPWLYVVPVVQLWRAGSPRVVAVVLLVPLPALLSPAPPSRPDAAAPAQAAWRAWQAGEAWAGATVRLLRGGEVVAEAETTAVLPAPQPGDALLVDVPGRPTPYGLVRPGDDGRRPPTLEGPPRLRYLRRFRLPTEPGATHWGRALVSAEGVTALEGGWTPPPALSPASLDAAARAGAAFLARNQDATGRFTYVVRGPSGQAGSGYNHPRHAGTAWFLARVAAALGDPEAARAAEAALTWLDGDSHTTPDGRRYVRDPGRKDGRTWIGTVALATLAEVVRTRHPGPVPHPPGRLEGFARQLVASVEPSGRVRAEMVAATGEFPPQVDNAYGQGQAMLALAAVASLPDLDPAVLAEARSALDRTFRYLDTGYYGTATPLWVPDEHWMCLAASAGARVLGRRSRGADGACATYLADMRWRAPAEGALHMAAGPAGAVAEAFVARAWDVGAPDTVRSWARHLLAQQYRPADAPLLGRPDRLLGGFRDGPHDLDVQIDAVQHIGAALLGAEALLSGRERPGSLW